jgi:hypothetical protein
MPETCDVVDPMRTVPRLMSLPPHHWVLTLLAVFLIRLGRGLRPTSLLPQSTKFDTA